MPNPWHCQGKFPSNIGKTIVRTPATRPGRPNDQSPICEELTDIIFSRGWDCEKRNPGVCAVSPATDLPRPRHSRFSRHKQPTPASRNRRSHRGFISIDCCAADCYHYFVPRALKPLFSHFQGEGNIGHFPCPPVEGVRSTRPPGRSRQTIKLCAFRRHRPGRLRKPPIFPHRHRVMTHPPWGCCQTVFMWGLAVPLSVRLAASLFDFPIPAYFTRVRRPHSRSQGRSAVFPRPRKTAARRYRHPYSLSAPRLSVYERSEVAKRRIALKNL